MIDESLLTDISKVNPWPAALRR